MNGRLTVSVGIAIAPSRTVFSVATLSWSFLGNGYDVVNKFDEII